MTHEQLRVADRYPLPALHPSARLRFLCGDRLGVEGLALGVATLITVLSVMNGFEREIRSRILSVTSHATLEGIDGSMSDWQDVRQKVLRQPGVEAASPYIEAQAMLMNGTSTAGAEASPARRYGAFCRRRRRPPPDWRNGSPRAGSATSRPANTTPSSAWPSPRS